MLSARLFRLLFRAYPRRLQRAFGTEMVQVFGDSCAAAYAAGGLVGLLGVWLRLPGDLAASALPARAARQRRHAHAPPRSILPRAPVPRWLAHALGARWPWRHPPAFWVRTLHRPEPLAAGVRLAGWRERDTRRQLTMRDRDRFEHFTERARRVLSLAQEEAQRFNHNYIGTEHLLLGLLRESDGLAARVLTSLGVEPTRVRDAVEHVIGRGDRIVLGEIGLTPRAKKVIELSVDEARRLGHHYVGTEHILLGLIREGEGIAAGVLESQGVNLGRVREQTLQLLDGADVARATPPGRRGWRLPRLWPLPRARPRIRYQARLGTATVAGTLDLAGATEGVRDVLRLAQEEARRLNHNYVGTEHLLLGLLRSGEGVAARVLNGLGISADEVRGAVLFIVGRGDHPVTGTPGMTPRARQVFLLAREEADRINHGGLDTEHLLLGLVREGEGIAASVLARFGAGGDRVRSETLRVLDQQGPTTDGAEDTPAR